MDEAAVKKLIDAAIAAALADVPSFSSIKTKVKGWLKTGLKGGALVAAVGAAVVAGHFL